MQSILHNLHDNGDNNGLAMSLINCTRVLSALSRFSAIRFSLVFRYPRCDHLQRARGPVVVSYTACKMSP